MLDFGVSRRSCLFYMPVRRLWHTVSDCWRVLALKAGASAGPSRAPAAAAGCRLLSAVAATSHGSDESLGTPKQRLRTRGKELETVLSVEVSFEPLVRAEIMKHRFENGGVLDLTLLRSGNTWLCR